MLERDFKPFSPPPSAAASTRQRQSTARPWCSP